MSTTATCFCGAIQLTFSLENDNLDVAFVCHCTDDRKITSSMFASNFMIKDDTLKHVRGQEKLTKFAMTNTIASGNTMTSHFCSVCGSLMYRISSGFPGHTILRMGQVDDLEKIETILKPSIEIFTGSRVGWLEEIKGMKQTKGMLTV